MNNDAPPGTPSAPAGTDPVRSAPAASRHPRKGRAVLNYLAAVALLCAAGFFLLGDYGLTWDEALGDLFFGNRYYHYLTSFDASLLDFGHRHAVDGNKPDLFLSPFRVQPWEYWPVANTMAAATADVLSKRLGLLDGIDGFHAFNVLLMALTIPLFWKWLALRASPRVAWLACGFLLTTPRFVAHAFNNLKDMPEAVFYTACIALCYEAVVRRSAAWFAASATVFGLALGTKANSVFIPVTLVLFLGVYAMSAGRRRQQVSLRLALALVAWPVAGAAVAFASWPYLWTDTFEHLALHMGYLHSRGFSGDTGLSTYSILMLARTTPVLYLAAMLAGVLFLFRKSSSIPPDLKPLLLLWALMPIARTAFPGALNFDGIRRFIEVVPPLCIVAADGAAQAVRAVSRIAAGRPRARRAVESAACGALLLPALYGIVDTHPFEIAYFNELAGGLKGARARGIPDSTDYWGTSYRAGIRWINENAPPGSMLVVPVASHIVNMSSAVWLRSDIPYWPLNHEHSCYVDPGRLAILDKLERDLPRPTFVMYVTRTGWYSALVYRCENSGPPVAVFRVQGADVLRIYRYAPPPASISCLKNRSAPSGSPAPW